MSHFRLLSLTTTGIGVYLYISFTNFRWNNKFKVNAQPESEYIDEDTCQQYDLWNIETYRQDLEKRKDIQEKPLTSTPIKDISYFKHCAFKDEVKPHQCISPTLSALKGKVFDVCCNNETGIPYWTVEVITADRFKKCPEYSQDGQCILEEHNESDPSFHAGRVPAFESYCVFDIDPCLYQLALPKANYDFPPNVFVWYEFYHLVKALLQNHDHIYICSGQVFKENVEKAIEDISHFFKVVVAVNKDGSYVFQCYLITNRFEGWVGLDDFGVSRRKLEEAIGFSVFTDIDSRNISHPNLFLKCLKCFIQ